MMSRTVPDLVSRQSASAAMAPASCARAGSSERGGDPPAGVGATECVVRVDIMESGGRWILPPAETWHVSLDEMLQLTATMARSSAAGSDLSKRTHFNPICRERSVLRLSEPPE